jgi:predicted secreted protein
MLRRCLPVALVLTPLLAAPLAVRAQTILHLSETATVMAAPDELTAILRADVTGASATEAQAQVNTLIQQALAKAHQVPNLTIATGGYGVWRVGPTPTDHSERWQVSQSLTLTSHDGPPLLKLVGELQGGGLVLGGLDWHLSRTEQQAAHRKATREALMALRGRVDDAAGALGLHFKDFKDIRLDGAGPQPRLAFAAPAPAMAMAASAPPPSAEAQDVPVTATAEAAAELVPH